MGKTVSSIDKYGSVILMPSGVDCMRAHRELSHNPFSQRDRHFHFDCRVSENCGTSWLDSRFCLITPRSVRDCFLRASNYREAQLHTAPQNGLALSVDSSTSIRTSSFTN